MHGAHLILFIHDIIILEQKKRLTVPDLRDIIPESNKKFRYAIKD